MTAPLAPPGISKPRLWGHGAAGRRRKLTGRIRPQLVDRIKGNEEVFRRRGAALAVSAGAFEKDENKTTSTRRIFPWLPDSAKNGSHRKAPVCKRPQNGSHMGGLPVGEPLGLSGGGLASLNGGGAGGGGAQVGGSIKISPVSTVSPKEIIPRHQGGAKTALVPQGIAYVGLPNKALYFADRIREWSDPKRNSDGFARIGFEQMRRWFGNQDGVAEAQAALAPFIDVDESYVAGKRKKGYRFKAPYRDEPTEGVLIVETRKNSWLSRILAREREQRDQLLRTNPAAAHVRESIKKITLVGSVDDAIFDAQKKSCVKREKLPARFATIRRYWGVIDRREFDHIKPDDSGTGRISHTICLAPREIRPYLRLDGETTALVDYSSLHPYQLLTLRDPLAPPDRWLAEQEKISKAVNDGRFYETISEEIGTGHMSAMKRGKFKKSFFSCCLFDYIPQSDVWKAFERLFPLHAACVARIHRTPEGAPDYNPLWRRFQSTEARIVLGERGVVCELAANGIPCISIHDAVMVPTSKTQAAMAAMKRAATEVVGWEPHMKIEWLKRLPRGQT